jgi:hypothetical protein
MLMIVPPAVNLLIAFICWVQLRHFQHAVPVLRTSDDILRLKHLAKIMMYITLIFYALSAVPLLVWLYGIFIASVLGWWDLLLYVVLPFMIIMLVTATMDKPAKGVRATPVSDPSLQAERDYIAKVWVEQLFPDW